MNNRIYLSPPFMGGDELKYIHEAFEQNFIAPMGENITEFERDLSEYTDTPYAVALSSATAAIHMALRYFGVGPGDFVFCSDFTFAGSCNPIKYQFANPVFIDSDPTSFNMSPIALEKAFIHAKKENILPKAVIIVDLYGQSADYDALLPICAAYNVPVIEDAAEALGASYKSKMCGGFGDLGIFSFNGNKIITTSGGGMAISHNNDIVKKLKFWSSQAREPFPYYEHIEVGYNYRMSNICAGIGRGQMKILDQKLKHRKYVYDTYKKAFENSPIQMMPIADYGVSNYWLSVLTIEDSRINYMDIIKTLEDSNIESRPTWKPMHLQPVFNDCLSFPHYDDRFLSHEVFNKGLCLPSGDCLTDEMQHEIIKIIKQAI